MLPGVAVLVDCWCMVVIQMKNYTLDIFLSIVPFKVVPAHSIVATFCTYALHYNDKQS